MVKIIFFFCFHLNDNIYDKFEQQTRKTFKKKKIIFKYLKFSLCYNSIKNNNSLRLNTCGQFK